MNSKIKLDRRSFLKVSTATAGGLAFTFSWNIISAGSHSPNGNNEVTTHKINGYLEITTDGHVIIQSPNPEIGQNVKTSMPMIIADELDVDWSKVKVVQAIYDGKVYSRQVAGGSQSIRSSWAGLRRTGATARKMLLQAASKKWGIEIDKLKTSKGYIIHPDGSQLSYGEVAAEAAKENVPINVSLKDPKDFTIIGRSQKNVDALPIVTGSPLFGLDTKRKGMFYACMARPTAFGATLSTYDDTEALKVEGVVKTIQIKNSVAVLASSTWAAIQGKKALKVNWHAGIAENTSSHDQKYLSLINKQPSGKKGEEILTAFNNSDQVIERVYEAPFLPHNTMEPMNFFASVTDDKIELHGPTQRPMAASSNVAAALKRPESDISLTLSRMGGGFGRRLMTDFVVDAALISDKVRKPVLLVYTREDDMTFGMYRPNAKYRFKAGIKDGKMETYYLNGIASNIGRKVVKPKNFPQGAVPNYLIEAQNARSNITTAPWRSPVQNFLAFAEQAFLDEVGEALGKDPIAYRLELLERASKSAKLSYDPKQFAQVVRLARDKSNWNEKKEGVFKGFSMYYSHNTYVAEIAEVRLMGKEIELLRLVIAVDCGVVINPDGAIQQAIGGALDGIGHAMYGEQLVIDGKPQSDNFNSYRLIKMKEVPPVEVYFVDSDESPTGMGEPTLPPAAAALANAIYAATGKRLYQQPFAKQGITLV